MDEHRAEVGVGADPAESSGRRHDSWSDRGVRPAIAFQDAAVRVGGRTLWSNVTLEIPRGEFVAILGPNGVGKSTLVKTVLGLVPLAEGSVEVLGRPRARRTSLSGTCPSVGASTRACGFAASTSSPWGSPAAAGAFRSHLPRLWNRRRRRRGAGERSD